jgi:hypothetical protein
MASRFHGTGARSHFTPLYGWEHVPLVGLILSLTDERHPLPEIQDLHRYAGSSEDFADDYLREHGGHDPHGLTREEIAAVNLYTKANLMNPSRAFYQVLNRTLSELDRSQIIPFFLYLKLFFTGVGKLKNACPEHGLQLLRAFPNRQADWEEQYQIGSLRYWWGFSSTTRKASVLESDAFFGAEGERTLFSLTCLSGVDISPYSDFPEAEVLLMPGTKFEVTQLMPPHLMDGVAMINMRQIRSRHDILFAEGSAADGPEPEPEGPAGGAAANVPEGVPPASKVASLLTETDLEAYAAVFAKQGYSFITDLLEADDEELAELIAATKMQKPEKRRFTKALAARRTGAVAGGAAASEAARLARGRLTLCVRYTPYVTCLTGRGLRIWSLLPVQYTRYTSMAYLIGKGSGERGGEPGAGAATACGGAAAGGTARA